MAKSFEKNTVILRTVKL